MTNLNKYIEEAEREFEGIFRYDDGVLEKWERVLPDGDWEGRTATLNDIKSFLSQKLREVALKVAEECVPEENTNGEEYENTSNDLYFIDGFNSCRNQMLDNIKRLTP